MTPTLPCLRIGPLLSQAETDEWTTLGERRSVETTNPRRRSEYLTWRTLVRRQLGHATAIGYNDVGAPVVPGGPCLSVSHCAGRVVVCLSEEPCAVDIEPESRAFDRVVPRYMTDAERGLCAHPLWPGMAWCAKEALYKYAGRKGLDLLRDLRVEAVEGFDKSASVVLPEVHPACDEADARAGLDLLREQRLEAVESSEENMARAGCEVRSACDEADARPEGSAASAGSKAETEKIPLSAGAEILAGSDSCAGAAESPLSVRLPEPYRLFATVAGRIGGAERLRIRIYRGEGYLVACIV